MLVRASILVLTLFPMMPAISHASSCNNLVNKVNKSINSNNPEKIALWLTLPKLQGMLGQTLKTTLPDGSSQYKWICSESNNVYLSVVTTAGDKITKVSGQYSNENGAGLFSYDVTAITAQNNVIQQNQSAAITNPAVESNSKNQPVILSNAQPVQAAQQIQQNQQAAPNTDTVFPEDQVFFDSHINDLVNITETRLNNDAMKKVFIDTQYKISYKLYDWLSSSRIVSISGGKLTDLPSLDSTSNSNQFIAMMNPNFKIKDDSDAQIFQDVLDQLYPIPTSHFHSDDVKSIKRKDNQWYFVRSKVIDFISAYIVTTNTDGTISSITHSIKTDLTNTVPINPPANSNSNAATSNTGGTLTPAEQDLFNSQIKNYVKVTPIRIVSDALNKVFISKFYNTTLNVFDMKTSAIVAVDGNKFLIISEPGVFLNDKAVDDFQPILSLIQPTFKLNGDKDAQSLLDALSLIYPVKKEQPINQFKHNGNQWSFIRKKQFDKFNEFVLVTNPGGSIVSMTNILAR